jgi:hypothetical protein
LDFFQRSIEADVTIDAPAERIWQILTDFSTYPEWNPFIRRIEGRLEAGLRLNIKLTIPNGWRMAIRPKILSVKPGVSLRWLGSLVVSGLFDGDHRFTLLPEGHHRTRFIQQETFSGMLVPLLGAFIAGGALRGFSAMNDALKKRAENA